MKKEIILIGGGGHCKACIDVIEAEGEYEIVGIIDKPEKKGQKVLGYEIIGSDNEIPELVNGTVYFLIAVGSIKSAGTRINLFKKLKEMGFKPAIVKSPHAFISPHAQIGEGTIIMHNASVNAKAEIGENCILNTRAIVEHDVKVGNHSHFSLASVTTSLVNVGEGVFVGANAVINNQIKIADNTIIGAGSVVTSSIEESGVYVGSPARRLST